jgi:LuxR family transcriptional regulator
MPDPFDILGKARTFDLRYGAVGSHGKITSRSLMGIARSDRECTDAEIERAMELLAKMHEVTTPPSELTPAMLEALHLVGSGHRHAAAAAKLGISESALKARLSSARLRLGARTTAEAIRKAREYGFLT